MPRNAPQKTKLRPVALKVPEDLYVAMKEIAEAESRSVNSQITVALRHWLQWMRQRDQRASSLNTLCGAHDQ